MSRQTDVAIIGSGPYGLGLAAHLRKKNVNFEIFGKPMGTWRSHMPSGMCLKSEGFATNLYHPEGLFTLEDFCKENGLSYAHIGIPVKLSTFSAYGLAFQRRFVPELNENLVTRLSRSGSGFLLELEDDTKIYARRIVIAAGITHFRYLPPILSELPTNLVSHSSRYHDLDHFKGQEVIVVGAGSSAIDVACSLHEAGARTQLVTRRASVPFHGKAPDRRPLMTRVRAPWSGLGPSWRSRLACDLPNVFHSMPLSFRSKVVKKHLGPAAGWFTKDTMVDNVPMHVGVSLVGADVQEGKVRLKISDGTSEERELVADHVIAGTGYRIDLRRLHFMDDGLRDTIVLEETSPLLSANFESSVPGLYFIGTCAALSFGPLLRFTFGAGFTSPRLSRHLRATARHKRPVTK